MEYESKLYFGDRVAVLNDSIYQTGGSIWHGLVVLLDSGPTNPPREGEGSDRGSKRAPGQTRVLYMQVRSFFPYPPDATICD
jgi:hypothetical protein